MRMPAIHTPVALTPRQMQKVLLLQQPQVQAEPRIQPLAPRELVQLRALLQAREGARASVLLP